MSADDFWQRVLKIGLRAGVKKGTLYAWHCRGGVPARMHFKLLKKAEKLDIPLNYDELNKEHPRTHDSLFD